MLSIVALLVTVAYSQTNAEKLLSDVSAKIKSYSSMSVDFRFTMINTDAGINETSTGDIALKGNKFKMHTNEFGMTVWNDGKNQWSMIDGTGEVNLESASDVDGGISPSKIFRIHEEGMKSSLVSETSSKAIVKLVPLEAGGDVKSVELNISKTNKSVEKATIFGSDGGRYIIEISNLKTNLSMPDSEFVFSETKNPSVNIIDLR